MKVRELIEKLRDADPDADVWVEADCMVDDEPDTLRAEAVGTWERGRGDSALFVIVADGVAKDADVAAVARRGM